MSERTQTQTLILILEEWVVKYTGKMNSLGQSDSRYSVADFMNATDLLFKLKGIRGETVTIGEKADGG